MLNKNPKKPKKPNKIKNTPTTIEKLEVHIIES